MGSVVGDMEVLWDDFVEDAIHSLLLLMAEGRGGAGVVFGGHGEGERMMWVVAAWQRSCRRRRRARESGAMVVSWRMQSIRCGCCWRRDVAGPVWLNW